MTWKTRLATVRYDQLAKKHPAEKHYFGVKHLLVESSLAWLRMKSLQCCKIRWHFGVKLEINEPRKSFEVQPKISGDSLISKVALMRQARNSSYTVHRDENYTFKDSLLI